MTASEKTSSRSGFLQAVAALVLAGIGLASSVYLTHVYVRVSEALKVGTDYDASCNFGDRANCVTVAASDYAAVFGIPISVWGLEFFGLAIIVVLGSQFRVVKHGDSLLFVLSCLGVPAIITLAYISAVVINSFCPVCVAVYAVVIAMILLFGIPNIKRLGAFVVEGPVEFFRLATRGNRFVFTILGALIVASQLFWLPPVFERSAHGTTARRATTGAKPGSWLGLPASKNTLGPVDAPIRIEEFTDFQCPYCGKAHEVMLEVMERFPGKIHLIHRDFPLDHQCNPMVEQLFHPDACNAAYFAHCAAEQNLYWPFEAHLFAEQKKLKPAAMLSFAETVGINTTQMKACVASDAAREAVLSDIKEGTARSVQGTPTLFVNGELIVGIRPIDFWERKIKRLLEDASGPDPTSPAASNSAEFNPDGSLAPPASGSPAPAASGEPH